MFSSNTRTTRSRFSSPAQHADTPKGGASEASRSLMHKWLEPVVQSKTSFEEDGLVRYGVTENMVPLGTIPKSKKQAAEPTQPVRKIILRPSGAKDANTAATHSTTPKPAVTSASPPSTPLPPLPPLPQSPVQSLVRRKASMTKETEDEEYDPKHSTRRKSGRAVQPSMKKEKAARSSVGRRKSLPTVKAAEMVPDQPDEVQGDSKPDQRAMRDRIVELAVDEALKHYRYPTAYALRTLYDERANDAAFAHIIDTIFNQTADEAIIAHFSSLMEARKREGRKDNTGGYYFNPELNSRITHKPKRAGYGRLIHNGALRGAAAPPSPEGPDEVEEPRIAKKIKLSHTNPSAKCTPRKSMANGVDGSARRTPGSRKRVRRDSGSSMSSLSSAMSLTSPEGSMDSASPTARAGRGGALGSTTGAKSDDAPKPQPIKTRRKSLASKHRRQDSNTPASASTSPTRLTHPPAVPNAGNARSQAGDMPGKLSAADLFPNLASKQRRAASPITKQSIDVESPTLHVDVDDSFWNQREEARKLTNASASALSFIRGQREPDEISQLGEEDRDATPVRKTRSTRHSLVANSSARATRSASKRPNDDADSVVSPVNLSFPADGSSAVNSRAATPTTLRPAKKQRSGLRIKSSPVKKRGGTGAGIPRSMGEAHLAVTNGASRDQGSDNDEYCSACGNAGDVVCCDGCPRSFHFECVDMAQSENLPDEWYCNECLFLRYPSRLPAHKGAFSAALISLERCNSRAFSLPKRLQNRFDGVKVGQDGEYEEIPAAGSKPATTKKKNGYEDAPDFFKQREDGLAVLCHACQKPTADDRPITSCSVCPLHWHIDCLDPPLAVPPYPKTWRCPAHVNDVLAGVPSLAPAHRFRKLKGAQPIVPTISRGLKNNGHIEVDWSAETEDNSAHSGWPDPSSFGQTYKLPAQSIVLDFIEQLRNQGAGYGLRRDESRRVTIPAEAATVVTSGSLRDRKLDEIQLSLNLASLKQRRTEPIDQLTAALLSQADDSVLALMAQTDADNIHRGQCTENDKVGLRLMLAQMEAMSARIRQLLAKDAHPTPARVANACTSRSATPSAESPLGKMHIIEPVTEPTPPSTIDHAEGSMDLD